METISVNESTIMKKFFEHVNSYGLDIYPIKLKYLHSLKVMDLCEKIAESLDLSEEDLWLSKLTGLFHDIGRFPQWVTYGTFSDAKSISHAHFGAELMEMGLIDRFNFELTEEEKHLLLVSIYHHTDRVLPESMSKRERLFCDIVRDADKIDILRYFTMHMCKGDPDFMLMQDSPVKLEDSVISPDILEQVRHLYSIKHEDLKTIADSLMTYISFPYLLNFDKSRDILRDAGYFEDIFKLVEFTDSKTRMEFEEIKGIVRNSLK